MGISFLDPDRAADVDRVAALYEKHLPTSPVVRLGPRFLREFFFAQLVRDGLLGCLVCHVDDRVVAFLERYGIAYHVSQRPGCRQLTFSRAHLARWLKSTW